MRPSLPVVTPRLVLRPIRDGDAEDLAAYRSIPEVCRYVPFEPMDTAVVRRRIGEWQRSELTGDDQAMFLAVEHRESGRVIGDLMLRLVSERHGTGEVGWVLHPGSSGQGFATEAAHGVLHVAFCDLGLRRMVARLDAENAASEALATRLGMRCEARLVENEWFKSRLSDELDFAMLAREWPAAEAVAARHGWCPVGSG